MSTTTDLYNEAIIKEAKAAAGAARLEHPDATVTRDNPLCGDRVTLDLALEDGRVAAVGQKVRGCLLTQAAAGLLARRAPGADAETLKAVAREVEAALKGEPVAEPLWEELTMFRPLQAVRSRHECVRLPFEALEEALAKAAKSSAAS